MRTIHLSIASRMLDARQLFYYFVIICERSISYRPQFKFQNIITVIGMVEVRRITCSRARALARMCALTRHTMYIQCYSHLCWMCARWWHAAKREKKTAAKRRCNQWFNWQSSQTSTDTYNIHDWINFFDYVIYMLDGFLSGLILAHCMQWPFVCTPGGQIFRRYHLFAIQLKMLFIAAHTNGCIDAILALLLTYFMFLNRAHYIPSKSCPSWRRQLGINDVFVCARARVLHSICSALHTYMKPHTLIEAIKKQL